MRMSKVLLLTFSVLCPTTAKRLFCILVVLGITACTTMPKEEQDLGNSVMDPCYGKTISDCSLDIANNFCVVSAWQFGNIVRTRIQGASRAEMDIECLRNAGYGESQQGQRHQKAAKLAQELGVLKRTPFEACMSHTAEVFEKINLANANAWLEVAEDYYYYQCTGDIP
jgi:hypothetical protein